MKKLVMVALAMFTLFLMSNSYFKFKQFTIQQDRCAMKVCTDACLFGSWVAEQIKHKKLKIQSILDIGSGTGLLSLMLAQKTDAGIDAVEIDEKAAMQAEENFEASPWRERLFIFNASIQDFSTEKTYDLIISNPPFFEKSLQSENKSRSLAKHTTGLSYKQLAEIVVNLLNNAGKFCLLLPYSEFEKFEAIASGIKLYLLHRTDIQQTPEHSSFRSMGIFTKEQASQIEHRQIIIKDHQNAYTSQFAELLKDYYLYL